MPSRARIHLYIAVTIFPKSIDLCCLQLSCFLVTAWEAFAQWEEKTIWEMPVEFLNVRVHRPVQAERTAKVHLGVIFDFSNNFQVRADSGSFHSLCTFNMP